MCQVSHVTYHMSRVMCHLSHVKCQNIFFEGGGLVFFIFFCLLYLDFRFLGICARSTVLDQQATHMLVLEDFAGGKYGRQSTLRTLN